MSPRSTVRSHPLPSPGRLTALARVLLGAVLAVLSAGLLLAGPAHAEDGYTYWGYYHGEGDAWVFSDKGPGDVVPADGSVEGYRFGTTTLGAELPPRADLAQTGFEQVCGDTPAEAGQKRVAVLLDFGTAEAAPDGQTPPEPRGACAVVPEDANGQQVLSAVADVRVEDGLTCGIDGYPVRGCGTAVKDAQMPANEQPVAFALPESPEPGADADAATAVGDAEESDTGLPWPLLGIGALVVLIALAAVAMTRRRSGA